MRSLAILLTAAGGVLPVAALVWAWAVTRREHGALDADLTRIQAIAREHGDDPIEARTLQDAVRKPTANYTTTTYMPEEVRRAILGSALADLRGPALLAGAGGVAGMVGALLAFVV